MLTFRNEFYQAALHQNLVGFSFSRDDSPNPGSVSANLAAITVTQIISVTSFTNASLKNGYHRQILLVPLVYKWQFNLPTVTSTYQWWNSERTRYTDVSPEVMVTSVLYFPLIRFSMPFQIFHSSPCCLAGNRPRNVRQGRLARCMKLV